MADLNGLFLNSLFSLLLKKIVVPINYHERVAAVKSMLTDDVSGLVDSLTDFSVQTASVDFGVETDNPELTKILKKWLDNINSPYKGQIPRGIKPLAEEYFKERWKSSSFPILKITKWEIMDGINVPTKMFFVDGESIRAEELDGKSKTKELIGYKYYLGEGKDDPLDKGVIITRPYGRWFDEYPDPFLIKRGVYHNYKIIQSLKKRESEILEQIIPYLLTIKKGDVALATQGIKTYTQTELTEVKDQFQELMNKMNSIADGRIKSPIRVTQFDEEIKHLIPDLSAIFNPALFSSAEKNILTGLGFIDVVEAVSTSRRESILNPKAFIEETKKGVEDFKAILRELVAQIIENNKDVHKKYMSDSVTYNITSSPVKGFITNDFKTQLRLLWKNGQLSNQSYCELVGEVEFQTEVRRREKEAKEGLEYTMYPHITDNREGVGIDIVGEEPMDKDTDGNGKPIPPDKIDDKDKYDIGSYEAGVKCSYCGNIFDYLAEREAGMGWIECPECSEPVTQKDLIEDYDVGILEEAFKPEITKNYIRLRQRDPVSFQQKSFRIITLSKSEGIKAVIGRLKGKTTTIVQSYLFDKKKWSTKEAQAWVEKHKASNLETAPYTKITQLPPSVKKKLSPTKQRAWMDIFNDAYRSHLKKFGDAKKAETYAFRVAWSQIKTVKSKKK